VAEKASKPSPLEKAAGLSLTGRVEDGGVKQWVIYLKQKM
jgi:hypothetical protein